MSKQVETIVHLPTLYYANGLHVQSVELESDGYVCKAETRADAEFIVNACNGYQKLVDTLKRALSAIETPLDLDKQDTGYLIDDILETLRDCGKVEGVEA